MVVLLVRSPGSMQVLVTWASGVVPFCIFFSGPDMSALDMRVAILSQETVGFDGPERLAVGMNDLLVLFWELEPL